LDEKGLAEFYFGFDRSRFFRNVKFPGIFSSSDRSYRWWGTNHFLTFVGFPRSLVWPFRKGQADLKKPDSRSSAFLS
jgi:hypothetical protein